MEKYFVIYNPLAGERDGEKTAKSLTANLDIVVGIADITKITNYKAFLEDKTDCVLVICGGDGTLHRFVNAIEGLHIPNRIWYCAVGTENNFFRDIEGWKCSLPIEITDCLQKLPVCQVNGIKYRFLNGVGRGIDGFCRKTRLHKYRPTGVSITVDGEAQRFDNVWMTAAMYGKYYSGGMMLTPKQNRRAEEPMISLFLLHNSGKIKTQMILGEIMKGRTVRYKQNLTVISGKEITVEFDTPGLLQMDGETINGVNKYSVHVYKSNEVIRRRHEHYE